MLTTHGLSRTKEYRRYYNVKNYSKYLLLSAKKNTKKYKLPPCNLEEGDLAIPEVCPVLGIPIKPSMKGREWNCPTVDRIIPSKGYVKGNVVIVSWRANRLKCDASLDEIRKIYEFYVLNNAGRVQE